MIAIEYSGEGFSYLQSVVEEITGQSSDDLMRNEVLMPLGMTSSRFSSDLDYARVAKPHDEDGKRIPGKLYTPPRPAERAEGMARYGPAAMLMTTGRLGDISIGAPESEAGGQLSVESA